MERVSVTGGYVTKDKNIVEFVPDGKATGYKLDINTGILYGLKGFPVETYPSFVVKASNELENKSNENTIMIVKNFNIIRNRSDSYEYRIRMTLKDMQSTSILLLVDKIINATTRVSLYEITYDDLKYIDAHFADFVKYMKNENIYNGYNSSAKVRYFYKWHTIEGLFQSYGLLNESQTVKNAMLPLLQDQKVTIEESKILVWYIRNQLETFFGERESNRCRHHLENYLNMCKDLNKPLEKKGNFLSVYNATKREWQLRKIEIDAKKLNEHYGKHSKVWEFETDKYCVRIPLNADDFIKEGEENQNCVAGYADAVLAGRTYVCFIRKKENPDKAFITAEIVENYNKHPMLRQFLLKGNRGVYGSEELTMLSYDFEKWISENW